MTLDEAIKILGKLAEGVEDEDAGLDEYYLNCRACEMGEMALSMLVKNHDDFCEFMRFYNEIDEGDIK